MRDEQGAHLAALEALQSSRQRIQPAGEEDDLLRLGGRMVPQQALLCRFPERAARERETEPVAGEKLQRCNQTVVFGTPEL